MIEENESGYTSKWIKDHLGITNDMIKNYIKAKLISKETKEMRYSYQRRYSKEELKKLWGIKLLIEMGYKTSEIYNLMKNEDNFYESLCAKVNELEEKIDKKEQILKFVKTIKLTGKIPKTKLGTIKFDDFINKAKDYWNIFDNESMVNGFEKVIVKKIDDLDEEDLRIIMRQFETLGIQKTQCFVGLGTYINIIAQLKCLNVNNELVIIAVKMLYKFILEDYIPIMELDEQIKPSKIVKAIIKSKNSDIAVMNKNTYGDDGVKFIIEAIDYYEKEYYLKEEC